MADNDRLRNTQERGSYGSRDDRYGRSEGRYEDFGGRPDRGRFTGEGGERRGREFQGGEGRYAEQGRYEDFGGRPDQGRFTGEGGERRGGTEGYGYGGGYRGGEDRYGGEGRGGHGGGQSGGGYGGDYYSGFYGADQTSGRGRSEDQYRGYGRGDDQRGYLDSPRSGAWRDYADPGRGEERRGSWSQEGRGFWDRATDQVSSWFRGESDDRRGYEGRGEHRGRGPRGYTRSDDRIRDDVNDRLTDDSYVDASDIEVSVSNREVTLSGTVDSRESKRRAEDLAESVAGVTHVQNNLRVQSQGVSGGATGSGPRSAAAQVTEPPLGESITAMNSSDANRIARETFGSMEGPTRDTTGSNRR